MKNLAKKGTKMSEDTKTVSTVEEIVVRRRGFDLDKFEKCSLEGKIAFTPLPKESYIQASLEAVGGDTERHYGLINSAMRRNAVLTEKNSLVPPDSLPNWIPSAKVVMDFVNNFRNSAPFNAIKDRKSQTKAIVDSLKAQPALMAALKTLAMAAVNTGGEEEEEEEE